jgi:cation diffusion facilitator family transporter
MVSQPTEPAVSEAPASGDAKREQAKSGLDTHAHIDEGHATREKRMAALGSVGSGIVLVSLKVFLAVVTGSLGVLSEALHSILDLVAAIITYLSVRVADKPADAQHLYGHGKVESFSAFVETGLLLLTAVYIIWEAFQRLFFHAVEIRPSFTAIAILMVGMGVDLIRSRALDRVAKKYPSEALEADALHFSTDVWSTFVVILGITGAWLGENFGIPWLGTLDVFAALVVAAVIIWIGSRLGKKTIDALLDVAPSGLREQIISAVEDTEGVLHAERVRVRRSGQRYFVDATISVPRTATLDQAHSASDAVEKRIEAMLPADVVVHVEPRAPSNETLFETIHAIAQRRGLAIHELSAHQLDGNLFVDLHLEVNEAWSLREAHRQATELEEGIRQATDPGTLVNIHIEPLGTRIPGAEELQGLSFAVQTFIISLRGEHPELVDCHDVRVRSVEHKVVVSCHCTMDGNLPITEVHDITAALESRVKEHFPQILRLTIHPEPVGEA